MQLKVAVFSFVHQAYTVRHKVREYDQEIPQSQTADQPTAP